MGHMEQGLEGLSKCQTGMKIMMELAEPPGR